MPRDARARPCRRSSGLGARSRRAWHRLAAGGRRPCPCPCPCRAGPCRLAADTRAGPCRRPCPCRQHRPRDRRAVSASRASVSAFGRPGADRALIGPAVGRLGAVSARAVGLWSAAGGRASGRARDLRRCGYRRFNSYVCCHDSRIAFYQLRLAVHVFAMGCSAVLIIAFLQNHNLIFAKSRSCFRAAAIVAPAIHAH